MVLHQAVGTLTEASPARRGCRSMHAQPETRMPAQRLEFASAATRTAGTLGEILWLLRACRQPMGESANGHSHSDSVTKNEQAAPNTVYLTQESVRRERKCLVAPTTKWLTAIVWMRSLLCSCWVQTDRNSLHSPVVAAAGPFEELNQRDAVLIIGAFLPRL